MMPQRIQRKRTKGWRMPENTVYVGRGSRWGNPYTLEFYDREHAVNNFKQFEVGRRTLTKRNIQKLLRGKNLACWCKLNETCHADILLKIANEE